MRRQALRRAADHDHDCRARPARENGVARTFGDGADPLREDELAVERDLEVRREGEQVRPQAGERRAEPSRYGRP
jgi:hypothetical protein